MVLERQSDGTFMIIKNTKDKPLLGKRAEYYNFDWRSDRGFWKNLKVMGGGFINSLGGGAPMGRTLATPNIPLNLPVPFPIYFQGSVNIQP